MNTPSAIARSNSAPGRTAPASLLMAHPHGGNLPGAVSPGNLQGDMTRLGEGGLEPLVSAWRQGGEARRRAVLALAREGLESWAGSLAEGTLETRRLMATALGECEGDLERILELLHALSADPDPHTRNLAARAAGQQLARRFAEAYPVLGAWRGDPEPWVRRAVPIAAATCARPERLDWAAPLLELIEPLLFDRSPELKGILGPRVLARELATAYPDDTFEYLTFWSTSYDEQVLWHVAMALSGPLAGRYPRKALIILRRLALDPRRYVRGAVAAALRRLGKLAPDPVLSELKRWLADEDRAAIARAALRALKP